MMVGAVCSASPPWWVRVTLTPISAPPPLYIGSISDCRSSRPCATGVGMLETQMMIVENKTTVIARIRIVPMTSEIPDSSSRKTTFIEWPPGGQERIKIAAEPTIYKVFAVVTTTAKPDSHLRRESCRVDPDAVVPAGLPPSRDGIRGTLGIRGVANKNRITVVGGAVWTDTLFEHVARQRRVVVSGIPPLSKDSVSRLFERIKQQRSRAAKRHDLHLRGKNRLEELRQSNRPDFAHQPVGIEDHERGPIHPCRRRRKVRDFSDLHGRPAEV